MAGAHCEGQECLTIFKCTATSMEKSSDGRCRESLHGVFYSLIECINRPRCMRHGLESKEGEPTGVMENELSTQPHGIDDVEIQEWLESLDSVLESSGPEGAAEILQPPPPPTTLHGHHLPLTP